MQALATESMAQQPETAASDLDFAELFRENYQRIYNYLRYRVPVPEDAEDLLSHIFEKAYTNLAQFDPAKAAFSTWLFQIAHNTLANYYRTRQRSSAWEAGALPPDLSTAEASPEVQLIKQEKLAHLLDGLSTLSDRDQEVISLKFAGRLSNKEIGQVMELKEKTVSVVLLRAMRRLQKAVKD